MRLTGEFLIPQPEVTEIPVMDSDDFVILATDGEPSSAQFSFSAACFRAAFSHSLPAIIHCPPAGLWDVVSSQEACRLALNNLRKGLSPQAIADMLCQVALKRYTSDNVAVVVVELRRQAEGDSSQDRGRKGFFGGLFG